MIARHRGDGRVHSGWRPAAAAGSPGTVEVSSPKAAAPEELADDLAEGRELADSRAWRRRSRVAITILIVLGVGAIAAAQDTGRTPAAALPSTPRQWVAQWTAASLLDPGRVCRALFAPSLAAAIKPATGQSCMAYYARIESRSFRVRRVIQDANAAAVEARQVGWRQNWGYFTVLLSRRGSGWQAIDIVPGGPIRPR